VRVPDEAGEGKARLRLSFPGVKEPVVAERTIEIAVEPATIGKD
jgi:hypothetical protein